MKKKITVYHPVADPIEITTHASIYNPPETVYLAPKNIQNFEDIVNGRDYRKVLRILRNINKMTKSRKSSNFKKSLL